MSAPSRKVLTVDQTPSFEFDRTARRECLQMAEMLLVVIGLVFLVIDIWKFNTADWSRGPVSEWLYLRTVSIDEGWMPGPSPNLWECLAVAAKTVIWAVWNTAIFLAYLTTRNFLTNVLLWIVTYLAIRIKFFPIEIVEEKPVPLPVIYRAAAAPAPVPTVHTQNAFGDAGFATPAALGRAFAGGSDGGAQQFFED